MRAGESEELLLQRWPAVEDVVRRNGGDPAIDLLRKRLEVTLHARSRPLPGSATGDLYVMRLVFDDYDEHAPRIWFCNPENPSQIGTGPQFYPKLDGNGGGVFGHPNFLCMPGDRRCYEQGHHAEWRKREHFHPEVVIESLITLLRCSGYRGRQS